MGNNEHKNNTLVQIQKLKTNKLQMVAKVCCNVCKPHDQNLREVPFDESTKNDRELNEIR